MSELNHFSSLVIPLEDPLVFQIEESSFLGIFRAQIPDVTDVKIIYLCMWDEYSTFFIDEIIQDDYYLTEGYLQEILIKDDFYIPVFHLQNID